MTGSEASVENGFKQGFIYGLVARFAWVDLVGSRYAFPCLFGGFEHMYYLTGFKTFHVSNTTDRKSGFLEWIVQQDFGNVGRLGRGHDELIRSPDAYSIGSCVSLVTSRIDQVTTRL